MKNYFDGLAWSVDTRPITVLELFLDYFAYTASMPAPRRGLRQKWLAKDVASAFGAMMRAMPKQTHGKQAVHPGKQTLTSYQTAFGIVKQAVALDRRPILRCPTDVHRSLAWAKLQTEPLDKWNWEPPWHLLGQGG